MRTPPWGEPFFFVFTFKICLPHQSVTPFLSGAPPPKKNPESASANRHGFDFLCHGKSSQHAQESGLLYSSHLGIARVTCATLYLYYMIAAELSLWTDFGLFDQRNTSAAHQLTSDLNKQQTSILFSSRKSATEERISIKYIICNLIKQFAKIGGRQK